MEIFKKCINQLNYLKFKKLILSFPLLSNTVIHSFRVIYHKYLCFTNMSKLTLCSKSVHSSIEELLNIEC